MTRYEAGPGDSPGFLLWHVTLRWQRAMSAALAPLGLTHVQFVLLACTWWLNEHGEAPNQLAVATQAGTDVKMASEVLRKLEAKGLLVRAADATDSRARALTVTEAGRALARQAVAVAEATDSSFLGRSAGPLVELLRPLVTDGPSAVADPKLSTPASSGTPRSS